jgi:hypothetical protein
MITIADQSSHHDVDSIDRLEGVLDRWRGRIDRLLVRADLASMDVSDEACRAARVADNAWLAAARKLHQIPKDAGSELGSLRAGAGTLLDDLGQSYLAAAAAVRRSRTGK